ncbi:Endonuclease III -like protein [Escovopsis weberi]|uniref:Endonuclease III homolog n=1 Tax=Escovopsis weberi TaxID=150374 RepID=A0A0N0RTM2_ESCWE|nr:Endonuclease III -like protein [Escovopsis weberi]
MRTSKISKDTAKLFERAGASSTSPAPPAPRRTTRSLAAKFGYAAGLDGPDASTAGLKLPDIEDAVAVPAPKKLKTGHTVSATSTSTTTTTTTKTTAAAPQRRARKPARKTTNAAGETAVEPPSDWEAVYEVVRRMRAPGGAAHGAAVDTMGCERLADRSASPRDQRFHTLIALMLSSQTKDTVNAAAMRRLQRELPAWAPGAPVGLNLENVLAVAPETLNEMIWAVGFHNNKTRYIKRAAEVLRDEWGGDIPDTVEGLTGLPGVGPKMAYLCLSAAWGRTEGIGVDVHVHRITNLWGWHSTRQPEETRAALEAWLPRDRWREINGLLVGLGQAVCLPVGRRCGDCELGLGGLCRAADRKKVLDGRRARAGLKEEEEEVRKKDDVDVLVSIKAEEEEETLTVTVQAEVKKMEDAGDGFVVKQEEDQGASSVAEAMTRGSATEAPARRGSRRR